MFALVKTTNMLAKSREIIRYFDDFCVTIKAKIEMDLIVTPKIVKYLIIYLLFAKIYVIFS